MNGERKEIEFFNAAVVLPTWAERSSYLDAACAGNQALRQKVEALLKVYEEADQYFEIVASPRRPAEPGTAKQPVESCVTEKPGDRIGRYKLLEKIGEGGFGAVWVAEQREPVKRRVALKIIKLGMDTKEVVARFDAERQALALMEHPNIAKILDAGATESGRPFFVMEMVRGVRITDYCDQNSLSTIERLKLFIQICHAIQHAHHKGIIHRDIKPSNILVTLHDGVPVPKVIDFGIAKATQFELTEKTVYTQLQQFIGTPAYMSPEQAEMSGLDIDTRSDIYSLGVLLYELLTSRTPFDPKDLLKRGLDEIVRVIREVEPLRPSTKLSTLDIDELTNAAKRRGADAPRLIHLLRGDLDWIVMKSLEKDRSRRYETADAFALDIQRHLNHEPVVARPPSAVYRFQKLVRRNRLAVTAAAIVTCALVLGIVISVGQAIRATRAEREQSRLRQQAEAHQKNATTEAARSAQVAEFMKQMLEGVAPEVALGRDTTLLREILERTARRVKNELVNQPGVAADLYQTLGRVYRELSDYTQSEVMHRAALGLRRATLGNEHRLVADSLNELVLSLIRQNRLAEADVCTSEALALRRRVGDEADLASSLTTMSWLRQVQGRIPEGIVCAREAVALQKKRLGEHRDVAISLNLLGTLLMSDGKYAEAEEVFRETLALRRKGLPANHPEIAQTLDALGQGLHSQGKLAEAEKVFREVLDLRKQVLGPEHSSVVQSMTMLSSVLRRPEQLAEAEVLAREAVAVVQKRGGPAQSIEFAAAVRQLGYALQRQGRHSEAEPVLREAYAACQKLGPAYGLLTKARRDLAVTLRAQKKFAEAEPLLLAGFEEFKEQRGSEQLKRHLSELARLYTEWGKTDAAAKWEQELVDDRPSAKQ